MAKFCYLRRSCLLSSVNGWQGYTWISDYACKNYTLVKFACYLLVSKGILCMGKCT